jgi:hypothetical protein
MSKLCFAAASLLLASSTLFAAVDQGLLDLVPAGTRVVAGLQVDKSKVSPLGQYLLGQMRSDEPGMQKLIDQTGFDPRRDLQEVLIATSGPKQNVNHPPFTIIARGTFDQEHIRTAVLSKGGHAVKLNGIDILTGRSDAATAVAVLDPTLAIAGSRAAVRSIVLNRHSPSVLDAQLSQDVESASGANEAWFASIIPGSQLPGHASIQSNGQKIDGAVIQSITQSSGGLHFDGDAVAVRFEAQTRSEKDAQSLSDVFRFFAGMIQMKHENEGEAALLAPVLNAMQLTTSGATMHMALSLPEKTVEQLVAQSHRPVAAHRRAPGPHD